MNEDVIVVGAGIVGLSVAVELAARGLRVRVLERQTVGSGVTAAGKGGIRTQHDDPVNVKLGLAGIRLLDEWKERFGTEIHRARRGFLYLTATAETAEKLSERAAVARAHGASVVRLTESEVTRAHPYLRVAGGTEGFFSPDDVLVSVGSLLSALVKACESLGVAVEEHAEAKVDLRNGVPGIRWSDRYRHPPVIVYATGLALDESLVSLGLAPVLAPARGQVTYLATPNGWPDDDPFIVDADSECYACWDSQRLTIGGPTRSVAGDFDRAEAADVQDRMGDLLGDDVRRASMVGGYAGLRPSTVDRRPVIGRHPRYRSVYLAGGFGGLGVAQALPCGRLIAAEVLGEYAAVLTVEETQALSPSRFE